LIWSKTSANWISHSSRVTYPMWGGADDVVHVEQGMGRVEDRLVLVDVDGRHAGSAGAQPCDECPGLDENPPGWC
jgi:hypothetical protein